MGVGDQLSQLYQKVTGKTPEEHVNAIKNALPGAKPLVNDSDAIKNLGAGREKGGYTITGGRRYRKKKGQKTRKTKRHSRR